MRPKFTIPLSYNPIDSAGLARKLEEYSHRHHNDLVDDFESKIRDLTGAKYAVGLNSGTAAIHLALKALGVQEKDRVIVSTFTYVASVNPILYLNAEPVLVDSEATGWNMDPELLETAIRGCIKEGKKPKAIIVVHTYGMPAKMNEILEIARRYDIAVLEDAAEAIGSTYQTKAVGALGEIGILSFNNNKTLTTFGGGMLLTNDKSYADQAYLWSTHSRKNLPHYEHDEPGFNYRLGPLNAAIGLVGLERVKENVLARRKIFDTYTSSLGTIPGVDWQRETRDSVSNRWITCLLFQNLRASFAPLPAPRLRQTGLRLRGRTNLEKIRTALDQQGIETRPLWKPMHMQPLFQKCRSFLNGTSQRLFEQGVCLPSGNDLGVEEIGGIVERVRVTMGS
jgi:dTDP-4-amino-4,6-dideoxygalactose transaminase